MSLERIRQWPIWRASIRARWRKQRGRLDCRIVGGTGLHHRRRRESPHPNNQRSRVAGSVSAPLEPPTYWLCRGSRNFIPRTKLGTNKKKTKKTREKNKKKTKKKGLHRRSKTVSSSAFRAREQSARRKTLPKIRRKYSAEISERDLPYGRLTPSPKPKC